MHVLITDRQAGKSTRLMSWVWDGVPVLGYPGWSRVAIVLDRQRHTLLKELYWARMEDFDHRVYTLQEIQTGHFTGGHDTAYRIDDLDAFLPGWFPGINVDGFTMTGSGWNVPERSSACVTAWPECYSGGYNPACCRFPKSCSCNE